MKEWRILGETLIWAHAPLLTEFAGICEFIKTIESSDLRECREFICRNSKERFPPGLEYTAQAIATNHLLFSQYQNYAQTLKEVEFFPAMELYLLGTQKFKRDWKQAWLNAGGKIFGEKMIAAVGDPVWMNISDFGFPFPPFSFDPAWWTSGVFKKDAAEYGIQKPASGYQFIPKFKMCGF